MGAIPPPPTDPIQIALNEALGFAATFDLVESVLQALAEATSKTAKTIVAFAEAVEADLDGVKAELETVHRRIALEAQDAIVESYVSKLLGTPTYRTDPKNERNRRYAGGVLEAALREPGFVSSDARGVYIGNVELLNSRARQWARLNYGAGSGSGGSGESFTVRLSDLDTFVLQDVGEERPGFNIPERGAGRWIGDEFYPTSELSEDQRRQGTFIRSRPTRGIEAKHYIDAGVEKLADLIGPAYVEAFKSLWQKADAAGKAALSGSTGLTRPGSPSTSVTRLSDV